MSDPDRNEQSTPQSGQPKRSQEGANASPAETPREESVAPQSASEAGPVDRPANVSGESGDSFLIVGIGASAGGLEAFQTFFRHMDSSQNMAFVLISHLSPDHESMLSELLGRETQMPVLQVQEPVEVERDHVYVIPPNADLTISEGVLHLSEPVQTRGHRVPIDVFFRSLAEDQGENAVCIVLSGTGSDGTLGLKAIKEYGGLAIAQDSGSAKYDSMPRSAAHTGLVDYILPVEEIPAKLVEYARHRETLRARLGEDGMFADTASHLNQICSLVRRRIGHDFSDYKQNTLVRRIQRRIQITQMGSVGAYVKYLRSDNDELTLLFKDLLIGVTHFFRNPDSFEALRGDIIASLIENARDGQPIRVWVTGCSSGEEAYSIAILLSEEMDRQQCQANVQIFATDIDERALDIARQARYPESIAEQITPGRLERFFIHQNGVYQVAKPLREMCIFSLHNLISDPPFSSLHLISCRNLLIYLNNELQRRVIPLFHYALKENGYLFLGSSENLTSQSDLFRTTNKQHRIFQKKQAIVSPRVDFPLVDRSAYRQSAQTLSPLQSPLTRQQQVSRSIERVMLQEYAPACVIINEQNDIVYFFGRTGNYLEPSQGVPSNNIFDLARRGLGLDLRAGIQAVRETQRKVVRERISVEAPDQVYLLNLIVRPLQDESGENSLIMVIFRDLEVDAGYQQADLEGDDAEDEPQVVRQLERELRTTKEHLRSTIEELETSNEELKSANEELLSMNEELQSSNEELQTSKEEMQSINEELETVNAELRNKIDELDSVNSDLQNLFESTQIATIFLSQHLEIEKFTPAANSIFNFLDTDIGRPITDMALRLNDVDIAADVRQVLKSLVPVEREVQRSGQDTFYKMRILPYRTIENVIDGAVITFVDVSDLRQSRHRAERFAERQQAIAEVGMFALQNLDIHAVCDRAVKIVCDTLGSEFCSLFVLALTPSGDTTLTLRSTSGFEDALNNADRSLPGYVLGINSAVIVDNFSEENRFKPAATIERLNIVSGMGTIVYGTDGPYGVFTSYSDQLSAFSTEDVSFLQAITNELAAALQREEATQALIRNQARLDLALNAGQMGVWEYYPSSGLSVWNAMEYALLGLTPDAVETPSGALFFSFVHPEDVDRARRQLEDAIAQRDGYSTEFRINRADGQLRWLAAQARVITDEDGTPLKVIGIHYDITDRKQIEADLQTANQRKNEFLAMLSHELRNPLNAITNSLELMKLAESTDRFDQFHTIATRQLRQFSRLVNDLLDISRIIHGKIQIQLEEINLTELLQNLLGDTQQSGAAKSLTLRINVPEQPIWIEGDPVRLTQAFSNILRNAIKFSQPDGSVSISAETEAEQVVVRIVDTGIGLAPEAQSRIFDAFSQESSNFSLKTGLGLGLPLARGIVELHNGSIRAYSAGPNQGTEISVQLPCLTEVRDVRAALPDASAGVEDSDANASETAPAAEGITTTRGDLPTKLDRALRVLVIEDNEDAREILEIFLVNIGCEVSIAENGEGILERAKQFQPEVIISDIGLPAPTSGYDIATAIRADAELNQIYLLATSGYGRPEDKAAAKNAGFDQHLTKPLDLKQIQQILQERIDESEM